MFYVTLTLGGCCIPPWNVLQLKALHARDAIQCSDSELLQVGSTILAQAAGVPTLPWSGSEVSLSYKECRGSIPADVYRRACVHTVEETLACCNKIQYPCMLKASWGGGGKGIRKVCLTHTASMCQVCDSTCISTC